MRKLLLIIAVGVVAACCTPKESEIDPQIIPAPVKMELREGSFLMKNDTKIYYNDPSLRDVATYAQGVFINTTGIKSEILQGEGISNSISIVLDESKSDKDYYELEVEKSGMRIVVSTPRSVILALQTIIQLGDGWEDGRSDRFAATSITDYPEWEWRGLMLDVSRHFFTKEELKRFIDMMTFYKFNKFHWHLSDDQGWRVEIKKYPLLTERGGWRTFNNQDRGCMSLANREHNDDYLLPEDKLRRRGDTVEYGGFYTQDDIREIVAYAAERGIDVVPEIDMPGHFTAAIDCYPELSCFNEPSWGHTFSAPICPGKDATLEFCKDIYREIFDLFPFRYVHIGADEVEKDNWLKCPNCQERIRKENLKDEKELQSWFVREMNKFFTESGKILIGWDEIIEGGLSEDATVMWWRTWAGRAVDIATSHGNEVILTPNSNNYFDYKQDNTTLRKLYEFNPVPQGITPEQRGLIKGVQANTWAEYIPTFKRVEYMTLPRQLALSEVAWRGDGRPGWDDFYGRLLHHFNSLDTKQVNYRPLDLTDIHTVNVFVGETEVVWKYPLPRVEIRYTTDGSIPDKQSKLYVKPFSISETTDFTIRYFRPDGTAADIVKTIYRKEEFRKGIEKAGDSAGLLCEWHEIIAQKCADIESVPVKQSYKTDGIVVPEGVGGKRGLVYTGYIDIDKEDIYTFELGSDDGSMLYIYDKVVVDNDGAHGPVVLSGQIALGKGKHPLRLYYFDMNNGGYIDLKLFDSEGNNVELKGDRLSH